MCLVKKKPLLLRSWDLSLFTDAVGRLISCSGARRRTVNEKLMTSGGISHLRCSGHVVQRDGSLSGCHKVLKELC